MSYQSPLALEWLLCTMQLPEYSPFRMYCSNNSQVDEDFNLQNRCSQPSVLGLGWP